MTDSNIEYVLHAIFQKISNRHNDAPGLVNGKAGYLIFMAYYQKYFNIPLTPEFESCFQELTNTLKNEPLTPKFSTGFTGIFWVLFLLKLEKIAEVEDSYFDSANKIILQAAKVDLKLNERDPLHGLIAKCNYLLLFNGDEEVIKFINRIVIYLLEIASTENDSFGWRGQSKGFESEEYYDLGLAHGISGIFVFLLTCYEKGIECDRIATLFENIHQKLIRFLDSPATCFSIYPNVIGSPTLSRNSRLGWCYGDLCIATMYRKAFHVLESASYLDCQKQITIHSLSRLFPDSGVLFDGEIIDTCFCHGSGGIALMLLRLNETLQDERINKQIEYWLSITTENLIKNFDKKSTFGRDKVMGEWDSVNYNLLFGISGVGLCLLSYLNESPLLWEKGFYIN